MHSVIQGRRKHSAQHIQTLNKEEIMIDSLQSTTTLSNGVKMPWLGLGVFRITDYDECRNAVAAALDCGYRSIDTALGYHNEEAVGEAIRNSGVPREELFVTSKLSGGNGYERAYTEFENSLNRLGLDYLDLYLIHWPKPHEDKYVETFQALLEFMESGKLRAVGVSNFFPEHILRLHQEFGVYPMVNQVERHPHYQRNGLNRFCADRNIQLECYSPLMHGQLAGLPKTRAVLQPIADKYGKSIYQVCLRWQLDTNVVCINKSTHPDRIRENADIFDFRLDADDIAKISTIDDGQHIFHDPYDDLGRAVHFTIEEA